MSPVLHTEAPPRVPGCLNGHAPKTYAAGRVCVACPTVLRRTNPGPWCDPCLSNDAKAGRKAKATKEEKVGKESLREAVLMVFARDPSRSFDAGDVVKSCGVSPSCVYKNLKSLVASGEIVKDAPGVYRWPTLVPLGDCIEDVKTALDTPPAPDAPVIPPPERAAESAPASDPPGNESRMPVPFAGIDYELVVIGSIVRQIESLTGHETRVRVAAYVASRFLP